MSTIQEIEQIYKNKFNKLLPSATISRWVNSGRLKAKKQSNGRYDYDIDSFLSIISSDAYVTKTQARKEKPEEYIGRTKGYLLIKSIVPKNEYQTQYKGTLMYCDCLACGQKNIQVRFTYLSDNGNYDQLTCGCGRKRRAFLASSRAGIDEEFLLTFDNFEKFLFVHKLLTHIIDNYYGTNCDLEKYKEALNYFYYNIQFNKVYDFWLSQKNKTNTFYDMAKPSLDHIVPISRGGTSQLDNLQVLTVFENLAKRDMTMQEWQEFKRNTNTHSSFFIEEVMA